jgi:hypothetical protein
MAIRCGQRDLTKSKRNILTGLSDDEKLQLEERGKWIRDNIANEILQNDYIISYEVDTSDDIIEQFKKLIKSIISEAGSILKDIYKFIIIAGTSIIISGTTISIPLVLIGTALLTDLILEKIKEKE